MTRIGIIGAFLATLLGISACSSSGTSSPPTSPGSSTPSTSTSGGTTAAAPVVIIKNFGYSGSLSVRPGQKVTVINDDTTAHTLTDKKTHKFDTGSIGSQGRGSFTAPSAPGKYPFGCNFHPQMAGTLVVQG